MPTQPSEIGERPQPRAMMKLSMSGHTAHATKYFSGDKLKAISGGNKTGYFDLQSEWNDPDPDGTLTLKFTPIIYINEALDTNKKQAVLKHEKRHFTDFQKLANALKIALEKAMKEKRDPEIKVRMKWFTYDRCKKSQAFHGSDEGGGYSVEMCDQPTESRPT